MGFNWSLKLLTLSSLWLTATMADFHLATVVQYPFQSSTGMAIDLVACPSNYYNCKCFYGTTGGDRAGYTGVHDPGVPDYFFIRGESSDNFCGIKQMNFYKENGQNIWQGYIDGGDGSVVATCYPGSHFGSWGGDHDMECTNINGVGDVFDQLVCYSYICNA